MWHILLWLSDAHHIPFLLNGFLVKDSFPFPILGFLPQNHLVLLKDRFLKKVLLKWAKTFVFFVFVFVFVFLFLFCFFLFLFFFIKL